MGWEEIKKKARSVFENYSFSVVEDKGNELIMTRVYNEVTIRATIIHFSSNDAFQYSLSLDGIRHWGKYTTPRQGAGMFDVVDLADYNVEQKINNTLKAVDAILLLKTQSAYPSNLNQTCIKLLSTLNGFDFLQ